jgi:hypothetical protein
MLVGVYNSNIDVSGVRYSVHAERLVAIGWFGFDYGGQRKGVCNQLAKRNWVNVTVTQMTASTIIEPEFCGL